MSSQPPTSASRTDTAWCGRRDVSATGCLRGSPASILSGRWQPAVLERGGGSSSSGPDRGWRSRQPRRSRKGILAWLLPVAWPGPPTRHRIRGPRPPFDRPGPTCSWWRTEPRDRISGLPETSTRAGRRWRSVWAGPSTSSPVGPDELHDGCGSADWNGCTGWSRSPGAGAGCWPCRASLWPSCARPAEAAGLIWTQSARRGASNEGRRETGRYSRRRLARRPGVPRAYRRVTRLLRLVTSFHSGRLLAGLLFTAIFSLAAVPPLDPDLWWHLANGRLLSFPVSDRNTVV